MRRIFTEYRTLLRPPMAGNNTSSIPCEMILNYSIRPRAPVAKRYSNFRLTLTEVEHPLLTARASGLCKYMYCGFDNVSNTGVALVNFNCGLTLSSASFRLAGLFETIEPVVGGYKSVVLLERKIMEDYALSGTSLISCIGNHPSPGTRTDLSEENAPIYHAMKKYLGTKKAMSVKSKAEQKSLTSCTKAHNIVNKHRH